MNEKIAILVEETLKWHIFYDTRGSKPPQPIMVIILQDGVDLDRLKLIRDTVGGRIEEHRYITAPPRWIMGYDENPDLFKRLERELYKNIKKGISVKYVALSDAMDRYKRMIDEQN